jgi:aldose 1-epimerase
MAPWAGRTGNGRFAFRGADHRLPVPARHAPHAIHGTVRDRPWTVEHAGPQEVRLSTELGPDWPWPGRCEQVLRLDGGSITLELSVHSADEPFPAVLGWHPWFVKPRGHDLEADAMLERGDDRLPTGRRVVEADLAGRRLDDCFEDVHWPVALHWPSLTVSIDATGCRYVVFYDEPDDSTCVEAQTGPPNGLLTGEHTVVTPDAALVASTTWSWHPPARRY